MVIALLSELVGAMVLARAVEYSGDGQVRFICAFWIIFQHLTRVLTKALLLEKSVFALPGHV